MKKMMIALMMLAIATTGKAMSYQQARNEALFLTDKMAYELNLTEEQYEAAYEINLDYLMGVTSTDDVYGTYWERRNQDLSYVLHAAQWTAFLAASYFYRPLYWDGGYWHFGIYARYPHRDYFYYGRPAFYATYRGHHAWHVVGGRGYYHGRRDHYGPSGRPMVRHHAGTHSPGFRISSTRTTVHHNRPASGGHHSYSIGGSNYGGHRHHGGSSSYNGGHSGGGSFSGGHSGGGSFSGGHSGGGSFSGSTHRSSGSFSGSHSGSSHRSSGSFSGSHGGGSSRSHGGGGRSFGGRR